MYESNMRYSCICQWCSKEYIAKKYGSKYCGYKCRNEADKKRKRENYVGKRQSECVVCHNELPKYKTKFCSDKCRIKFGNQTDSSKQRRRTYIKTHRRRYEGITIDSDISLFKLAERDGQQCQICGLMIDWSDSPQGDMYPSVDHIKPISLGGLHSWDNVQLAHRKCNYMKSNKYTG